MIKVNEKWSIGTDKHNIILFETHHSEKLNKDIYSQSGFYSTLHGVLQGLVNEEVRDSQLSSVKEVIAKLDELSAAIKSLPNITLSDLHADLINEDIDDSPEDALEDLASPEEDAS